MDGTIDRTRTDRVGGTRSLRVIFLTVAGVVVVSVITMFLAGLAVMRTNQAVIRSQEVIDHLRSTVSTLKDAETGHRGFLLTGEERFLEPYTIAKSQIDDQLRFLDKFSTAGDLSTDDVARLRDLAGATLKELDQAVGQRRSGGVGTSLDVTRMEFGKQLMDDIRTLTERMVAYESAELRSLQADSARLSRIRTLVFILAGVLNVGFLGWMYGRIRREMDRRDFAYSEVARQRELLSVTLGSIGDGVIVTDNHGDITFLNPVAEQLTGWTSADATGQTCTKVFNIVNEDTRAAVDSPVDKVLKSGAIVGLANHTLLIRKDGTELPIDDSGAPIRGSDGNVSGVVMVFRDFTDHKSSEKKLKDAMALLKTVTDSTTDLIYAKDQAGNLIFGNPATFHAIGKTPEQVMGRPDTAWVPDPDEARAIMENDRKIMLSKTSHTFEEVYSGPKGKVVFLSTKAPLLDEKGNAVGIAGVTRDITDRKHAEEKLRVSEERFRIALKNMPVSVYTNDADLRYVWIYNPPLGFTADQVIGRRDEDLLPIESVKELVALKRRVLDTGVGERREISSAVFGAEHVFDVTVEPDTGPDGKPVGITVAALETTELVKARQEAEAATIAKDNFLATLSHELRTPLTPVVVTLAEWEKRGDVPDHLQADVLMMRRNVDLEARLIDDLLDLTRIVRGKLSFNAEVADIHELISAVAGMYQAELNARKLVLTVRLNAERHHVYADPARLQQVFWNILKNATKFTPPGGTIDVRTSTDADEWVRLSIRDSGIGMSPELLDRLFKPFEQGTTETVRRYGGLGLGMTISKALMEAQGGTIVAHSDGPNRGATFTVALPSIAVPDRPQPAPSVAGSDAVARMLNILLVEDHADTARVMSRLLRNLGHQVSIADSVAGAMKNVSSQPFDLLLSDIGLPDGTGLDLIRQVRVHSRLPAIALTGYGMEEDVAKCRAAGFDDHLTKPVNFQKLEQVIDQLARRG